MYNALRPRASTEAQLLAMADRLETTYAAPVNAALVREAAEVYGRRRLLAEDDAEQAQDGALTPAVATDEETRA
jgi:propanediol dehydratase small subunit